MRTSAMRTFAAIGLVLLWGLAGQTLAGEEATLHLGSLPVSPAHTPPVYVTVRNPLPSAFDGQVALSGPEGWILQPAQQPVHVPPGETARVAFTVHRGALNDANRYPMEVRADGAGGLSVVRRQEIVCASAPYFKPTIDGQADDWADAIPVTFMSAGKRTTVRTYWNRRSFAVEIEVEEDRLVPWQAGGAPFDAVQIALAPQADLTSPQRERGLLSNAETAESPTPLAQRLELLLLAGAEGQPPRAFLLARPAAPAQEAQARNDLTALACPEVELAVTRDSVMTRYEASIPFSLLDGAIRPAEGREFCFSVLVHDPDGTGVRDWGQAAGLGPEHRQRSAWCDFAGSAWGDYIPFAPVTVWGLCSSKY